MKNLKNLGQALSKAEQKLISGGQLDANPIPPPINCYVISCAYHGEYVPCSTDRSYPVGWQAIYPAPAGC